jgi:hypothetical protein
VQVAGRVVAGIDKLVGLASLLLGLPLVSPSWW